MKLKHNKKRNTAFLFESLVRELTKTSLKGHESRKKKVFSLIKEFFNKKTVLYSELQLYKALCQKTETDIGNAQKVLQEAKERHAALDKKKIFNRQTQLIKKINETLGKDMFENFIPNYKDLATIYQVLYKNIDVKKQVTLEEQIVKKLHMTANDTKKPAHEPISKLAFKNFFNKFNDTYGNNLLKEQKELIHYYVTSFERDELEFKIYLNEELGRLKETLTHASKTDTNELIVEKREQILKILDSFKEKEIDSNILEKVLKIQQVAQEITNGN